MIGNSLLSADRLHFPFVVPAFAAGGATEMIDDPLGRRRNFHEAHLDDHRAKRRAGQSNGTRRCSASPGRFRPMKTLGRSSIQMELSCSSSTSGAPTSIPH